MAGGLTTHVLDTASGRPAAGMLVQLFAGPPGMDCEFLREATTNGDGRLDGPLLSGDTMEAGTYTLCFHVGDYFSDVEDVGAKQFLDIVPVVFAIAEPGEHYHVPLLVTPWSYATYRGS